jgi:hypothetical protein
MIMRNLFHFQRAWGDTLAIQFRKTENKGKHKGTTKDHWSILFFIRHCHQSWHPNSFIHSIFYNFSASIEPCLPHFYNHPSTFSPSLFIIHISFAPPSVSFPLQFEPLSFDFGIYLQGCTTSVWTGPGPTESNRFWTESSWTNAVGSTQSIYISETNRSSPSQSLGPIGSVQVQVAIGPTDWTDRLDRSFASW